MKKLILSLISLFVLAFLASIASAQTATPTFGGGLVLTYTDLTTFARQNNMCPEAFLIFNTQTFEEEQQRRYDEQVYTWQIPDLQPCYNAEGQRLMYYDIELNRLPEPEYQNFRTVPLTGSGITNEQLMMVSIANDVCVENISRHNIYHHAENAFFVPTDAPPCYRQVDFDNIEFYDSARNIIVERFEEFTNVCVEQLEHLIIRSVNAGTIFRNARDLIYIFSGTFYIPNNILPCYNEQGQRLRFTNDDFGYFRYENGIMVSEYTDLQMFDGTLTELHQYALDNELCYIDIAAVNGLGGSHNPFSRGALFIPDDVRACESYGFNEQIPPTQTVLEASIALNVCVEDMFFATDFTDLSQMDYDAKDKYPREEFLRQAGSTVWNPANPLGMPFQYLKDAPPCYTNTDDRILPEGEMFELPSLYNVEEGVYTPLPQPNMMEQYVYTIPDSQGKSLYDVALVLNVCVEDLMFANRYILRWNRNQLPYQLFVPITPPCYDPVTKRKYNIATTQITDDTQDQLQHIVLATDSLEELSFVYNVCINRIADANGIVSNLVEEDLNFRIALPFDSSSPYPITDQQVLIIPQDRLDCYDLSGNNPTHMSYHCYNQEIDFSKDYTGTSPMVSFDPEGAFCYPLRGNFTIIYENESYRFSNIAYEMRPHLMWCQRNTPEVTELPEEVNDLTNPSYLAYLGSFYISKEIQACLDEVLANPNTYYLVESGDSLWSVSRQFGKTYQQIIEANQMSGTYLYEGYILVIPPGPNLWHVAIGGGAGIVGSAFIGFLWRRRFSKGKKKNG
jgi:LysM repeat protein